MNSKFALLGASICFAFGPLLVIGFTGRRLAIRHGSDIRIVWYLFSLALISTSLIAWWATNTGAIDSGGSFHGTAGAVLHKLLELMLDLPADLKILATMVALVVLPQVLSYGLSGLFGCAVAPMLVGPTFRFFLWSVVKSFAIAAGTILVVAVYGWGHSWNGLSGSKAVGLIGTALLLVVASFLLLYMYRDLDEAISPSDSPRVVKLRRALYCVNAWASRRIISPTVRVSTGGVDRSDRHPT